MSQWRQLTTQPDTENHHEISWKYTYFVGAPRVVLQTSECREHILIQLLGDYNALKNFTDILFSTFYIKSKTYFTLKKLRPSSLAVTSSISLPVSRFHILPSVKFDGVEKLTRF